MTTESKICAIVDCHNKAWARGWCNTHYMQWRRQGDPEKRERHPRTLETKNKCTHCGKLLPPEDFHVRKKSNTRYSWCKRCVRLYLLKKNYNLDEPHIVKILEDQSGLCAGCGKDLKDNFCVDHDHSCCAGEKTCGRCVRGLLCKPCNLYLKNVENNFDRIKRMVAYLGKHNIKQ